MASRVEWAEAFEGIEGEPRAAQPSWYTGTGAFQPVAFAAALSSFSSSVNTAIASTPGGSGASGFRAGSVGGGVGGGGGGSW